MIKVKIIHKNNNIEQVEIIGHAEYDEWGKDIICAAVSSTILTTVNAIISLDEKALKYLKKKDKVTILIKKHDHIVDHLINNMVLMLKELEHNYSDNIKITEEV